MILRIKVKPGSKSITIKKEPDGTLKIRISAPPVDGKANKMLIDYLAEIFKTSKSSITIKSGQSSRYKTLILPDDEGIEKILQCIGNE